MLEVITATGLVLAGSAVCGSALCRFTGMAPGSMTAPAVGFVALVVLSAVAIQAPGGTTSSTVTLSVAIVTCAWGLRAARGPRAILPLWGVLAAIAVVVVAMIPFAAIGRVGLLGAGTNDDMAEHLLAAWTLQGHLPDSASKLVTSGYPIGPHSLVATISSATGTSLERAFTGVIVAVPALVALCAGSLLRVGPRALRASVAAAVGLCYLQAAYLVQASFKEPMEAMILLAFVAGIYELGRRQRSSRLQMVPLAVLAAGAVYIYSYPGLLWLGGTAVVWAAARFIGTGRSAPEVVLAEVRSKAPSLAVGAAVFAVLTAPQVARMLRFSSSGYDNEGATVLGDLLRPLRPLEGLGVWPRLDFRFDVPVSSLGGILALLALVVVVGCLIRCLRRREWLLPSALIVAATIYGLGSTRSPYTAGKALAVLAPLGTLLVGREMLLLLRASNRWRSWNAVGAALVGVVLVAGAYSDLELLRDAPVGSAAHGQELSALRTRIGHSPTLFLGSDDFVHWELRGANLATPPAPLYTKVVVPLRRTKAQQDPTLYDPPDAAVTTNKFAGLGLAFDFDSVPSEVLDRFSFVIVVRSAYSSTPPANWRLVDSTRSYELWSRVGPTPTHQTLTEIDNPGAILDCTAQAGRAITSRTGVAMVRPAPVIGERNSWKGQVGYAGRAAHQVLVLGRGRWDISLQYDSAVKLTVEGPGLRAVLSPNLEPLGPYWFVGTVRVSRSGPVRLVARYASLPWVGRTLGAFGLTRAPAPTGLRPLGRIVATRSPSRDHPLPLSQACGRYVDWYRVF